MTPMAWVINKTTMGEGLGSGFLDAEVVDQKVRSVAHDLTQGGTVGLSDRSSDIS